MNCACKSVCEEALEIEMESRLIGLVAYKTQDSVHCNRELELTTVVPLELSVLVVEVSSIVIQRVGGIRRVY